MKTAGGVSGALGRVLPGPIWHIKAEISRNAAVAATARVGKVATPNTVPSVACQTTIQVTTRRVAGKYQHSENEENADSSSLPPADLHVGYSERHYR